MPTARTPLFWLTFLRILVGASWLVAAFEKISDPSYVSTQLPSLLGQWANGPGPVHAFVAADLVPHAYALGIALEAVEIVVGISLVLGLLARLGAFGGFAIVAAAWVFKHAFDHLSGYALGDFLVMVTMLFLVLAPSGRHLGIDAVLLRRERVREPRPATTVTPPTGATP